MKAYVSSDELYPYHEVSLTPQPLMTEMNLPKGVVEKYIAAEEAFDAARTKLMDALKAARLKTAQAFKADEFGS